MLCSCTNPIFGKNLVPEIQAFFKQLIYKQHQAEIGKKSNKS